MDKSIKVLINNDKSIFVETENYKGQSCVSALKDLLKGFLEIENFNYKSDYYENEIEINDEVKLKI